MTGPTVTHAEPCADRNDSPMQIAVIGNQRSLSGYAVEILHAWGLRCGESVSADTSLDPAHWPVALLTEGSPFSPDAASQYVEQGGHLIVICPQGPLATLCGVEYLEPRQCPLRLRTNAIAVQGLAGEALPVPTGIAYRLQENATALAWLYDPTQAYGLDGEIPGIIRRHHGKGATIAIAFDLPRAVMMLRQGDPALADRRLDHEMVSRRMCKPSNLAVQLGAHDAGWLPFADLLGRLLVDLILQQCPSPMPLLSTMPANASGMVLISGDEDKASLAAIDQEMSEFKERGVRMNMYIIPELTHSNVADADRYREVHHLGPHPNLIPLADAPIADRVAEYERQIRLYAEMFNSAPRSVRNHAAGWAGYVDLVYVQQRYGIRMDLNYFSGNFSRERDHSPYSPFGAALPMRFAETDGSLLDVFQQHTHLHDDILFAPDRDYSYKFTTEVAETLYDQLLSNAIHRFQLPIATNFHPGNWYFARDMALLLIRMAQDRQMLAWSYDQWLDFWEGRDICRMTHITWADGALSFVVTNPSGRDDVCIELPIAWQGRSLVTVVCNGAAAYETTVQRGSKRIARIPVPCSEQPATFTAVYG